MTASKSLIINTREYGMFSSLFQIIDNLKFCEMNNMKPILNIGEKFLYRDGPENPWTHYFKPINDGKPEGEVFEVSQLTTTANFFLENYIMAQPSIHDYRLKLWNMIADRDDLLAHRQEIKSMLDKYVKPLPVITEEVQKFAKKNFKGNSVLSVHIRSTDYKFVNLPLLIDRIDKIQKQNNYKKIFVASDSLEAIMGIYNAFPNVCYYETGLRCEKIDSPKPLCHIVFGQDKIKHGRDAIIECLLLSKGKEIVCINSNVAGMACYLNPQMKIHLMWRQIHGG
jgi:hypothetical protein